MKDRTLSDKDLLFLKGLIKDLEEYIEEKEKEKESKDYENI